MQLVRKRLDIGQDVRRAIEERLGSGADVPTRVGVQLLKLDGQHGEALANVVVKLSGNAAALLFMRRHQAAAERGSGVARALFVRQ